MMHYYRHHIGDFLKDTGHLSNEQMGIYLRMLWKYYLDEKPLQDDCEGIAFAMRSDEKTVRLILRHFFVLADQGWRHKRCDKEIVQYHSKSEKAKTSASARWNNADAMRTHTDRNADASKIDANQKPITNNQEPVIQEGKPSLSGSAFPPCPYKELLSLWGKHLPHLTQPRSWEGTRQANMRQRWGQAGRPSAYSPDGYSTVEDGIKWWDSFFGYIAKDTSLANGFETKDRTWRPDLEWVVNATNFQKIIDGKYSK
jgi:uncharacterized protein YdaU (DUF1376 family)